MKVKKFTVISLIVILLLSILSFILIKVNIDLKNKTDDLLIKNDIKHTANIEENKFIVYKNDKAKEIKIKAVRLSEVTPNYERNQTSIATSKVKKWLKQIKKMNANAIIIPYIQSPNFYQAIYEYNLNNSPIYIIHEVEINTNLAKSSYNLYDNKIYDDLYTRVVKTIDVVHGRNLLLNAKKTHTGLYLWDISNYVIGYIIGTDIIPEMVAITNLENKDVSAYNGKYFKVKEGTAFECLIAKILNESYNYEFKKYHTSKLYSFSSIIENDPFSHYNETNTIKNAATNFNNIKSNYLFASIVAYPDALSYIELGNNALTTDYYYDYLVKYHEFYDIPIVVSNIGISTTRGISNVTLNGSYHRGGYNENEQANFLVDLLKLIDNTGVNGVGINSFQDDWGKMSASNMKNIINENNNNYWYDTQSSDEGFGLMKFASKKVIIDGENNDFKGIKSAYHNKKLDFKVTSDPSYLYLSLNSFEEPPIYIGFDILSKIGSKSYETNKFDITNDFVLKLNGVDTELFVNNRYDIFTYNNYFYDNVLGKLDNAPSKNTKEFNSIYLLNQKKLLIQSDSSFKEGIYYNTGKFTFGNCKENSLTDFNIKDNITEIRIPWSLLNINNPIDRVAQGDFYKEGALSTAKISNIKMQIVSKNLRSDIIKYKIPSYKKTKYKEVLKKSYFSIKDYWEE